MLQLIDSWCFLELGLAKLGPTTIDCWSLHVVQPSGCAALRCFPDGDLHVRHTRLILHTGHACLDCVECRDALT